MTGPDHDILIVGAGISGISMAAHLQMMCPGRSFRIIERRAQLGGTWDLFRYPGIRSDSDMHSLGFSFAPWRGEKAIADGEDILAYLQRVVGERRIDRYISFGSTLLSADWRQKEALWHVVVENAQGRHTETARFLYFAAGYYDYDNPHDADIPGLDKFAGQVIHPQFWPQDLDWSGKRVVVIGSGATAVTIVPAMAEKAEHITMLQRTPTWMFAQPSVDKWARWFRRVLPERQAYRLTRFINTRLHSFTYRRARSKPEKVGAYLTKQLKKELGEHYSERDFLPPYNPWEQRLCLVPDSDLFRAIRGGKASVTTGTIAQIESDGVLLEDGSKLPADIIVTATGLRLSLGGSIDVSLDGKKLEWPQHWFYRNCMFSNVPNLSVVFGYLNAAWTLRAEMTARFTCRVLNAMTEKHAQIAMPLRKDDAPEKAADPNFGFSSGYIRRASAEIPRSEAQLPWKLNMDFMQDLRDYRDRPVDDGVLQFSNPQAGTSESAVAQTSELA
jgi:cation diffusion facilitator CzcD-associated flavoprotein CzcO